MRLVLPLFFLCLAAHGQVSNLKSINSALDEQAPVLSPDGKELYFTITSHTQNAGGIRDHGDIWVSTLTETGWGPPVHTGPGINNSLHNIIAGFSADGKKMYLMNHYSPDGSPVTTQASGELLTVGHARRTSPFRISRTDLHTRQDTSPPMRRYLSSLPILMEVGERKTFM